MTTHAATKGNQSSLTQTTGGEYSIYTYWVRGPVRTNNISSPAYDAWSSNIVWKLYSQMGLPSDDVGYRLQTEYVTQPAATLNSNTLHLVVRIIGKNGAKVALNQLRFSEFSTDVANTLKNSYSLVGLDNLVYSPKALGITYSAGGARSGDSVDTTGSGSIPKDEIVFIGMQSLYYPFTDFGNYNQIDYYLTKTVADFRLIGSCEVVGSDGSVLSFARRMLMFNGVPATPAISIGIGADRSLAIGASTDTNQTSILLSSPVVGNKAVWTAEGTINNGTVLTRSSDASQKFYRLQR